MNKREIADTLREIALLLELQGANTFKIRAYENGARILESIEEDVADLVAEKKLSNIKGIGDALAKKIETLVTSGELPYLEDLREEVPSGLVEMLDIAGLGGKKVKALHDNLGIESIGQLKEACESGKVAALSGFGKKSQEKILRGIENREAYSRRHLWWDANAVAQPLLNALKKQKSVEKAACAGSLRRGMETVGDLDFLVASDDPEPVMEWFVRRPEVREITARGDTKSSVRLEGGLQADLRVVPSHQFHFALHHFTGSKDHNVEMRQRALARGYSLSEWGLSSAVQEEDDASGQSENKKKGHEKLSQNEVDAIDSEAALFKALGLAYIPPELREGRGEIEVAEDNAIPDLIKESDIKGAFHNHTTASDGHNSLREMVAQAQTLGWQYIGIADHSKSSFQANGLSEERLMEQLEEIRKLNESGEFKTWVFAGVECDILPEGELDYDDELLSKLDYVVASVHNVLNRNEKENTARILKAIANPHVTIMGHISSRLLLRPGREGMPLDIQSIVKAAKEHRVMIELNANPHRLDMDWRYWRKAAQAGVLCCINPDAHAVEGLDHMKAGVLSARKGWLEAGHVFNTRPLDQVKKDLQHRKQSNQ